MKILWFSNVPFPEQLKRAGTEGGMAGFWMLALMEALCEDGRVELAVCCESGQFSEELDFVEKGVRYVCLPPSKSGRAAKNTSSGVSRYREIIKNLEPDVAHVHGTENSYGLLKAPNLPPVIVTIQGLLDVYTDAFWGHIPFFQRFRFPSMVLSHRLMKKKAVREREIISVNQYFGGRTLWDHGHVKRLNPNAKYYHLPELLRECFFNEHWDINQAERFQIYSTTTPRSYKGTDVLIDAVALLKKEFPQISLRIGGPVGNRRLSWSRYLRDKVIQLGLSDNISFLGFVSAESIVSELKQARVYVLPSFIENSPNSLGEAQLVGTPVVSTMMGGVLSMLRHEDSGLLTNVGDASVMAEQIGRIFKDDGLAQKLCDGGRVHARDRHNPDFVVKQHIDTYSQLIKVSQIDD